MDEELKKEIRKMALQNAFEHGGETRDKIILGKILGTKPEFRNKVKEISKDITEIVSSINKLSSEEQESEIKENFPELLAPKEKIEENVRKQALKYAERAEKSLESYSGSAKTELISLLDFVVKRSV